MFCTLGGEGAPLLCSAHLDTLGAMVRSIKDNGRLRIAKIGSYPYHSIERCNVTVHTTAGLCYSGTVQYIQPSSHVSKGASDAVRSDENIEIVLDERVASKDDCKKLGIQSGDFISFDPKFVYTKSGFIKSRHLDDKAGAAALLALAEDYAAGSLKPARKTTLLFTIHEEVGHGGSAGLPEDLQEMIAVDMGAVGDDLEGTDTCLSICAMDSRGPYDRGLTQRLVKIAGELGIDYALDLFPFYGSDADAALAAGADLRHALIGPGVSASHGYERSHRDALDAVYRCLACYIQSPVAGDRLG